MKIVDNRYTDYVRIRICMNEPWMLPLSHFVVTLLTPSSSTALSRTMTIPMLCRVIEIIEVAQVVIDHLCDVSPKSVVSLACTCKALEEQALRTLWSNQPIPLRTLVRSTLIPDTPHCILQMQGIRYERVRSIAVDI